MNRSSSRHIARQDASDQIVHGSTSALFRRLGAEQELAKGNVRGFAAAIHELSNSQCQSLEMKDSRVLRAKLRAFAAYAMAGVQTPDIGNEVLTLIATGEKVLGKGVGECSFLSTERAVGHLSLICSLADCVGIACGKKGSIFSGRDFSHYANGLLERAVKRHHDGAPYYAGFFEEVFDDRVHCEDLAQNTFAVGTLPSLGEDSVQLRRSGPQLPYARVLWARAKSAMCFYAGRLDEAEREARQGLSEIQRLTLTPLGAYSYVALVRTIDDARFAVGETSPQIPFLEEARVNLCKHFGPRHPWSAEMKVRAARAQLLSGNIEPTEVRIQEEIEDLARAYGANDGRTAMAASLSANAVVMTDFSDPRSRAEALGAARLALKRMEQKMLEEGKELNGSNDNHLARLSVSSTRLLLDLALKPNVSAGCEKTLEALGGLVKQSRKIYGDHHPQHAHLRLLHGLACVHSGSKSRGFEMLKRLEQEESSLRTKGSALPRLLLDTLIPLCEELRDQDHVNIYRRVRNDLGLSPEQPVHAAFSLFHRSFTDQAHMPVDNGPSGAA